MSGISVGRAAGPYTEGARVYNSANVSITNDSFTALSFDTERFDTDTIHSTVTNTNRLTATTAGKYIIVANVEVSAHATGQRFLRIRLNGTTVLCDSGSDANSQSGQTWRRTASAIYEMAATDYVEMLIYQNSGGTLSATSVGNLSPEFMMHRIG